MGAHADTTRYKVTPESVVTGPSRDLLFGLSLVGLPARREPGLNRVRLAAAWSAIAFGVRRYQNSR